MTTLIANQMPCLHRAHANRGMVLVVVLVVIALLALGSYTFSQAMLGERMAAQAHGRRIQTRAAADSGLAQIGQLLVLQNSGQPINGGTYNNPDVFQARPVNVDDTQSDPLLVPMRFTMLAPDLASGMPGVVRYGLEDESARLNLNTLVPLFEALSSSVGNGGATSGSANANSLNSGGASNQNTSGQNSNNQNTNTSGGNNQNSNAASGNTPVDTMRAALSAANPADALMNLPGMTQDVAEAILDWLDADEEPRTSGAEYEYYSRLEPPYAPRNGPIDSLDELLMIRGVTSQLLYGLDQDQDGIVSPKERSREAELGFDNSSQQMDFGWAGYLTLHSAEGNLFQGQPKVNLNAEDLTQLSADLQAVLPADWVNFIIAYRQFGAAPPQDDNASGGGNNNQGGDQSDDQDNSDNNDQDQDSDAGNAGDPNQNNNPTPIAASAYTPDLNQPATTKIGSVLDLIRIQVRTSSNTGGPGSGAGQGTGGGDQSGSGGGSGGANNQASGNIAPTPVQIIESPFTEDTSAMAQFLTTLLDTTTVTTATAIPGRININEAPVALLNSIPGMTPELANTIQLNRQPDSSLNPGRAYPTWLLTEGLISLDEMKLLLPFVTCRGGVYRARVVGFSDQGGPSVRVESILDTTTTIPRQLSWKELTHLGVTYPREILGTPLLQ